MKTVFSSHSEVCHVFASQDQETGTAGNISFRGPVINSYHWWVMAKFVETAEGQKLLFRDWSYSRSTSQHLNHLRSATSHIDKIFVNDPSDLRGSIEALVNEVMISYNEFEAGRKKLAIYSSNCHALDKLHRLETLLGCDIPYIGHYSIDNEPTMLVMLQEYQEKKEAARAAKEAKEEERRAKIKALIDSKDFDGLRELWRSCQSNETFHYHKELGRIDLFSSPALRIKGDQVQSSMHANAPVREAKILFARIQAGKDIKGFKIGYYTVISINGTLKIGCHEITRDEIELFTTRNNW